MDKYGTLRNQVVWAVTHYGVVNTEGIIERLRETVLELDSEQLQNTSSNSDYAKCRKELVKYMDKTNIWVHDDIEAILKKHFA